jgi:myosin heavy subunit
MALVRFVVAMGLRLACFAPTRVFVMAVPWFVAEIEHYAGKVVYDSHEFVEKNKDAMWPDIVELWASSTRDLVKKILPIPAATAQTSTLSNQFKSQVRRMPEDVATGRDCRCGSCVVSPCVAPAPVHYMQLSTLMGALNSTEPHYIRCIKPNDDKRAGVFNTDLTLQQLGYAGVLKVIAIRQQGFPCKWSHKAFFHRYRACCRLPDGASCRPPWPSEYRERCVQVRGIFPPPPPPPPPSPPTPPSRWR